MLCPATSAPLSLSSTSLASVASIARPTGTTFVIYASFAAATLPLLARDCTSSDAPAKLCHCFSS